MTLDLKEIAVRVRRRIGWGDLVRGMWFEGKGVEEIAPRLSIWPVDPWLAREMVVQFLKERSCVSVHLWHARCWECDRAMQERFRKEERC